MVLQGRHVHLARMRLQRSVLDPDHVLALSTAAERAPKVISAMCRRFMTAGCRVASVDMLAAESIVGGTFTVGS
jgi:hypothetical protein